MIEIRDVTKTHLRGETEVRALRGVSCEIEHGTFSFIVGPSGSGKSTLLYLIGALDEPTSGEIVVDGRKLSSLSARDRDNYRRSEVGFIFQSFNLLNNLTAVENVLVPFLPKGVSGELRSRAVELLNRVGLSDRLDHRPNQLSGGEQQRVAIARALLKHPKLVLADEPTGELDSQTGKEVFGYLREMHQSEKTTVIVVTHDERYFTPTDRIITLRDGQIALATEPTIKHDPERTEPTSP
jgi:putative ABC transport system ATP-binding protein